MEMRDHENRVVETIPINRPRSPRLITILRETLTRSLIDVCIANGVDIKTSSHAVGATAEGMLELSDGSRRPADLVIGADGINSLVRDSLDLMMYRKNTGYGAFRLMIKRTDDDLPGADVDKYIEHFSGTRRFPIRQRTKPISTSHSAAPRTTRKASPPHPTARHGQNRSRILSA
jgi:2-polyprenyl-6-methoxyphenol hydroxylase-like FAD-dependent oxidoreductase